MGIVGLLTLANGCAQPPAAVFPHTKALDSLGAELLTQGPIAGFSIGISHRGEVVYERGFGVTDVATGAAATSASVYNIASTAKILAAAAVMNLVEAGTVRLDDTLGALLPAVPNKQELGSITLSRLLNMTSGLEDYVSADVERLKAAPHEPLTSAFVLDHVRSRSLVFEPGTNWIYTNTGFYLAGLIVERASGMPWGEFVIENIARPLGLEETYLCDDVTDSRSRGYERSGAQFVASALDGEKGVRGDAGLCSTVRDLARLPAALEQAGVVSIEGLETMLTPTRLESGLQVDYGLGVSRGTIGGHRLWGHLGGSGSIVSTLAHYPDDGISIAVLVNTRGASLGALAIEGEVARIVLSLDPSLEQLPVDAETAGSLTGIYQGDREGVRYEIVRDGSTLVRIGSDNPDSRLTLMRQDHSSFGRSDWPFDRYVFQTAEGRGQAISAYYNGFFDGFYRRVEP